MLSVAYPGCLRDPRIHPHFERSSEDNKKLFRAVCSGDLESVEVSLEDRGETDKTLDAMMLMEALYSKRASIITALTLSGVHPDSKISSKHHSPIVEAVRCGHIEILEALLKAKANPNQKTVYGDSVLMLAIRLRRFRLVELLLAYGADPNELSERGDFPLRVVFGFKDIAMLKLLIDHGMDLEFPTDSGTPFIFEAANSGWVQGFELLLKSHVSPDSYRSSGQSILEYVNELGYVELFDLLIEYGADPDFAIDGVTPLATAITRQDFKAVTRLMNHKERIDLGFRSYDGIDYPIFADLYGSLRIQSIFPKTSYSEKVKAIKSLAQFAGLSGTLRIDGIKVDLERFYPVEFQKTYTRTLNSPVFQAYMRAQGLLAYLHPQAPIAFARSVHRKISPKTLNRHYHNGELVIMPSYCEYHHIALCFQGPIFAICNTDAQQAPSIVWHQIDPSKISPSLFRELIEILSKEYTREFEKVLYAKLPLVLGAKPACQLQWITSWIQPKPQKVANCTASAARAAFKAALIMNLLKTRSWISGVDLCAIQRVCKITSAWIRRDLENKCIAVFLKHRDPFSYKLILQLVIAQTKRIKKVVKYNLPPDLISGSHLFIPYFNKNKLKVLIV